MRNPMANVAITIRRPRRIALDDMLCFASYELSSRRDGHFRWALELARLDRDSHDSGVGF